MAHHNLGIALRSPGEAGGGDRRIPRGHPAQARPRRRPLQPRHRPGDQGKLEEAIAAYRTAIRLKPDYAEAHYNLGIALHDQGKLEEAIAEYRTAIRLKPDYANAHYNLGLALHDQGKLEEAIAEYRAAIRLKPDDAEPTPTSATPCATRGRRRRRSPNSARPSASSPTSPGPLYLGIALQRRGEAGGGDRRIPHGHPTQARSRRGPHQPRQVPS